MCQRAKHLCQSHFSETFCKRLTHLCQKHFPAAATALLSPAAWCKGGSSRLHNGEQPDDDDGDDGGGGGGDEGDDEGQVARIGALSTGRTVGVKIKLFGQIGPSPNTWGWTLSFRHTFYKENQPVA